MVARIYADTVDIANPLREEWMDDAACEGEDPEIFFDKKKTDKAKAVCNRCEVRLKCLAKALVDEKGTSRRTGVFGGMGSGERKKLQERLDEMQKQTATANKEQEEETNHD
ncbi:WhiB family transcription factor [Microbacterium phage EugeneKrabs]|nr:WhiB family transcription factor [Microbacterium phage EugeneKrabs]